MDTGRGWEAVSSVPFATLTYASRVFVNQDSHQIWNKN